MQDNPNGLLVFRDELSSLFKKWEINQNGERGFYLQAWSGDGRHKVERKTVQSAIINGMCLSIFGAIQPDVLMKYVQQAVSGGEHADGMIQRYQLAVFPDPFTYKFVDKPTDIAAREKTYDLFKKLQALSFPNNIYPTEQESISQANTVFSAAVSGASRNNQIDGKHYVSFDAEAQAFFEDWLTKHQHKLASGVYHPAMTAHLQKYRKLMTSLCLIFHCIEAVDQNNPIGAVSFATAQRAAAWCQFLERHAQRIYAYSNQDLGTKILLRHIIKGDLPQEFTLRDIQRRCWSGLTDRNKISFALDRLAEDGILHESLYIPPDGGRSTTKYKVVIRTQ
jgi:hypothetical protein